MPDHLLTVGEVAAFLRCGTAAIYNQRLRGDLPGSLGIRVGNRVLFRPADLEAWLAAGYNRGLAAAEVRRGDS